jgi:hypothetical protein
MPVLLGFIAAPLLCHVERSAQLSAQPMESNFSRTLRDSKPARSLLLREVGPIPGREQPPAFRAQRHERALQVDARLDLRVHRRRNGGHARSQWLIHAPRGDPDSGRQLVIYVENALRRRALEIENRAYRERLETLVEERTRALRESVLRLGTPAGELRRSREETIRRLSRAGEYRDEATGAHVTRVGRMSASLARSLGLPDEDCELIGLVSPLHDIGKVGISDAILRKPGPLDVEERAACREDRAHLARDQAAAMIRSGRGSKFDPDVVDAYFKSYGEMSAIADQAVTA